MNKLSMWPLLAALSTSAVAPGLAAAQAPARPAAATVAEGAKLQLRWELQRAPGADAQRGTTPARFVLTNRDTRPLPAQGWAIFFNSMDRLRIAPRPDIVIEQVAGYLFRLRPGEGFKGLAPGQSLEIAYQHPDGPGYQFMQDRAPLGPYLVQYGERDTITPIDYAAATPNGRGGETEVTPQQAWERNARILPLAADAIPPVVPTPLELKPGKGRLALAGAPVVSAAPELAGEAALARSLFSTYPAARGPALRLALDRAPDLRSPEAYRLSIDPAKGITVTGNSPAGVAHGLQTLRDLLPLPWTAAPSLPALTIVDAPRFGYRGFMLDVARNFHSKETVFKWLDLMARFKLNKFHFHLTDDEGWRLEIAGLPELTTLGALRGHDPDRALDPAYGSGADVRDASGSGYYSRADYIEILRYAKARHIEVIPEIEMPGHARAAVKAMEARYRRLKAEGADEATAARHLLHDFKDRSKYESPQMYTDHVLNPGVESSYTFVEHVVKEVVALHREAGVPLATIHMGGDELPDGAWERSPASLAMMAREKLETSADLWDYFYDRVDGILRKHGLYTSGWEELAARKTKLDGRPALIPNPRFTGRGFTAYVWNNTAGAEDLANRLANAGYDIVLTPVTRMYLDMAHNANPYERGVNWGGYVDLDTVYDFIPLDINRNGPPAARSGKDRLTDYGKRRVRGLQANLFSETVRDPARIDHLVMPRLIAVAERGWAADPAWAREADPAKADALHRTAWSGFVHALGQRVLPRLDLEKGGLAYRIAPPGLKVENGRVLANHVLPGTTLRYTSDGSAPTAASALVTGPIAARGVIRVAAFDRNGRAGQDASVDNR